MNPLFSEIRLSRYAPAQVMAPHEHDEASLSLVLAGSYEERIRGRCGEFGAGALLVCPAHERHAQRFGAAGLRKIVLSPTPEAVARLQEAMRFADAPAVRSRALAELGGVQCGYCTPGIVMTAAELLARDANPDRDAIRRAVSGNLCRCTGYHKIVDAVEEAAQTMRAAQEDK